MTPQEPTVEVDTSTGTIHNIEIHVPEWRAMIWNDTKKSITEQIDAAVEVYKQFIDELESAAEEPDTCRVEDCGLYVGQGCTDLCAIHYDAEVGV